MADNEDDDGGWMKVESRTKKNKFYFFNVYTGESVWKLPESSKVSRQRTREANCNGNSNNKTKPKVVKESSKHAPSHGEPSKHAPSYGEPSKHAPSYGEPSKHAPSYGEPSKHAPSYGEPSKHAPSYGEPSKHATCESYIGPPLGIPPLVDDSVVEENSVDMEDVAGRWLEDEEIEMDMDISVDLQQQLVYQVQEARAGLLQDMDHTSAPTLFAAKKPASSVSYQDNLYLVLDTNILLSHLDFLMELKDCAIKGVGRPVLVIPWTVMQELDGLKNQDGIGDRARRAIQFLHSCFLSNHPRVRGQTMEEVNTELSNMAIENNDDRILHCCLVYQLKVQDRGGIVVLFSNDTQLCSKSLVNGVKAVNRKILLPELRSLCRYFQNQGSNPMSYAHTAEYAQRVSQQVQMETAKAIVDDIICQTESVLRDGLSIVVEEEMKVVYDNLWLDVVMIKPPWTFHNIVHLMEKHWIAVFGFLTPSKAKVHVKGLVEYCRMRHKSHGAPDLASSLLEHSSQLLRAFSAHSNYNGVITHSLAALEVLHQKLSEVANQCPSQADHVAGTEVSSLNPLHLTPKDDDLQKLLQSPPSTALEGIPWVLGAIYDGVKLRSTKIVACCRERKKSGLNVEDLRDQLEGLFKHVTALLASINNFVCSGQSPSVATSQDLIQVIDKTLLQIIGLPNPLMLSVDNLYSFWMLPDSRPLFQQALAQFNQVAAALQEVVVQFF